MNINGREIDRHHPPYIIGEIGCNHDGSFDKAMQTIAAFKDTGVAALKLQVFEADKLFRGDDVERMRRYELPMCEYATLANAIRHHGLHAIATVFSLDHVPFVTDNFDAIKVASPDCTNKPLIDAIAETGKPMIVSTGAADCDEIRHLEGAYYDLSINLLVMECVSAYPCPIGHARISAEGLGRWQLGYSDHTTSWHTGGWAVAAGYVALEKHVTLTPWAEGADHRMSMTFETMAEYVTLARDAYAATRERDTSELEEETRRTARQSIVAARAISTGEVICRDMLTFKRPGDGLTPDRIGELLGKITARTLEPDETVTEDHFSCVPSPS